MGKQELDPRVSQQYTSLYGPLYSRGDYQIDDVIPGQGEVIWAFLSEDRGLVYVVSENNNFPFEVAASEVRQK
jgi:hypothetical protein